MADPQSFNRYAYVGNDPVNFTDPSGLLKAPPHVGFEMTVFGRLDPWESFFGGSLFYRDFGTPFDEREPHLPYDPDPFDRPERPEPPQNPAPTEQGRLSETDCNNKLASIFGGSGAVVSTVNEPPGIHPSLAGDNRIHHLANNGTLHIYGNGQGTATDAVYTDRPAEGCSVGVASMRKELAGR